MRLRLSEQEPSRYPVVDKTGHVVEREEEIGSWLCESERIDVAHPAARQKRAAEETLPKPRMGEYRCLMPRWSRRESIVEVRATAVDDLRTKCLADGTGIGVVSIGRHSFWCMPHRPGGLFEKVLGRLQISLFAEPRINQVPIPIDGTVKIAPSPLHLHVGARPRTTIFLSALAAWPSIAQE